MIDWGSDLSSKLYGAMVTSVFSSGGKEDKVSEISSFSVDDEMLNSEEEEMIYMEQDRIDLRQRTMSFKQPVQYLLEQAEDIEIRAISTDSALDSEEQDNKYVIRDREHNERRMRTLSSPFPGSFEEQQTHTAPNKNTSLRDKRRPKSNQQSPSFACSSDLGSSLRGEKITPSFASGPQRSFSSTKLPNSRSGEKMQPSLTASDRLASSASSFGKKSPITCQGSFTTLDKCPSVNFMIGSPDDLLSTEQDILDSYTTIKSLPDDAILNSEEEETLIQEHDKITLRRRTLEVLESPEELKEETQEPGYTSEMNTEDEENARSTQDRIINKRRTDEALEHIQQAGDEEQSENNNQQIECFKFGKDQSPSEDDNILDSEDEADRAEENDRIKTRRQTLERLELRDVRPDLAVDSSNALRRPIGINSAEEEEDNIKQDRIQMRRKTLEILLEAGVKPPVSATHLSETEGGDPFTPQSSERVLKTSLDEQTALITIPTTTSSFRTKLIKKKTSGKRSFKSSKSTSPPAAPSSPTSPEATICSDPTIPCITAVSVSVDEKGDVQRSLFQEERNATSVVQSADPLRVSKPEETEVTKEQNKKFVDPTKSNTESRHSSKNKAIPKATSRIRAAGSSPLQPKRVAVLQSVVPYLDRTHQQQHQQVMDKMHINPLEATVASQRLRIVELETEVEVCSFYQLFCIHYRCEIDFLKKKHYKQELHKHSLYAGVDRNEKIPRNMEAAIDIILKQGEVIDRLQQEVSGWRKSVATHSQGSIPMPHRIISRSASPPPRVML